MHLIHDRRGLTLVELLASLALLCMLLLSVITLLVPFGKAFTQLRFLQSRQSVADTLAEKVAGQLRGATAVADPGGGQTIVFTNPEGYIVLISSAEQSGTVPAKKAEQQQGLSGTPYLFPAGRASQLYCNSGGETGYTYRSAAANGFDGWFGSNFYQGTTLAFSFTLQPDGSGRALSVLLTITLDGPGDEQYVSSSVIDLGNEPSIVAMNDIGSA